MMSAARACCCCFTAAPRWKRCACRAARFLRMTVTDRCTWPLPWPRINCRNGKKNCASEASPSKAAPPGRAPGTVFISATPMGIFWSWRRLDCGRHTRAPHTRPQRRRKKSPMMRGLIVLAIGAVAFAMDGNPAAAQAYPSRPVTIIVPFSAGGTTDVIARILGEHMSRTLGQQFIVENAVGAGGTTGSIRAKRASPDGYTVELGNMGTHAASVALYPTLAYNPEVDFAPIGMVAGLPVVIVGKKDFPPGDLKQFATYVRANADKLNMAHAGVGSITHFTCLLLNSILGVKPTLVPFNGAAPAISALIGGQVDYMCNVAPDVVQQIQGGAFKAYAIGS